MLPRLGPGYSRRRPQQSRRQLILSALPLLLLLLLTTLLFPHAACEDNGRASDFSYDFETSDAVDAKGLEPPFIGEDLNMAGWDFGGDTLVDINNYIRLASDRKDQTGWLWSRKPLGIKYWEIDVDYRVHGKLPHYVGDGIGMWFVDDAQWSDGDAIGFKSSWNGFGVLIDTYDNGHNGFTYPRIAGFNNSNTFSYNKDKDGVGQDVGSCEANIYNKKYATRLRITQSPIGIKVSIKGEDAEWKTCFEIKGASVPPTHYVGFTGNTGGLSANFDLRRVRVIEHSNDGSAGAERPPVMRHEEYMAHKKSKNGRDKYATGGRDSYDDFAEAYTDDELDGDGEASMFVARGGGLSHFSTFLLLVAFAGVATAGYKWYRAKQERDLKRF